MGYLMDNFFKSRCYQNYKKLDLDYIVDPSAKRPDVVDGTLKIYKIDKSEINPKIVSELENVGLDWFVPLWFVTPPNHKLQYHIDGSEFVKFNDLEYNWFCGLNWDISNTEGGGLMSWYNTTEPYLKVLPIDPPLYYFGSVQTPPEKICEHLLTGPCLIHTGILHSMQNLTDSPRYCFSIRFSRNYSFDEIKEKLDTIWTRDE